jgi:hypothetical protein
MSDGHTEVWFLCHCKAKSIVQLVLWFIRITFIRLYYSIYSLHFLSLKYVSHPTLHTCQFSVPDAIWLPLTIWEACKCHPKACLILVLYWYLGCLDLLYLCNFCTLLYYALTLSYYPNFTTQEYRIAATVTLKEEERWHLPATTQKPP